MKKKTMIVMGIGIVLVAVGYIFQSDKYNTNNNIPNTLDLSGHFEDKNMARAENNNTTTTTFPIAFMAWMRTSFENQTRFLNLYKPYLRPGDYVSTISASEDPTQNLNYTQLLPGMKGVVYYSLAEIKNTAQSLKKNGVDFIGYDLESEYSPDRDLSDPMGSIRRASEIVHQNGLKFIAVPGYPLNTNIYATQFAPHTDINIIQAQENESSPDTYKSFVISMVGALKAANPHIRVITELSTNKGTIWDMEKSFSLVAQYVDGVTVWPESVDDFPKVKEFLEWFNHYYRQK